MPRDLSTEHHIIPDIVPFLNGLPVVVIECKSPKVKDAIPEAIGQMMRYSKQRGVKGEGTGTPHNQQRSSAASATCPDRKVFGRGARCGAKTRKGTPFQCPSMGNGRCRLHGGLSTGPTTQEGRERIRRARWRHGRFSAAAIERRRKEREEWRLALKGIEEIEQLVAEFVELVTRSP